MVTALNNNMSNVDEVAVGEEVQVELPSLQDPSGAAGITFDSASGEKQEGGGSTKRPSYPTDGTLHAAKKAKVAGGSDPTVWESLLGQIRGQLRNMTSDECFSRALELQMLARSEVGSRSQHLSNAMDLMAQPGQLIPGQQRVAKGQSSAGLQLSPGQRVTKAEREVSKQKPIKTNKATPVPCMKMTPPLPPRCEHDNCPNMELPAFCQLVNFPTARYYNNCVMCDESEFTIPKQNKGVCNNCDVAIWVVNPSGMNIKWCKGCKNFRKWIDFGVKVCFVHMNKRVCMYVLPYVWLCISYCFCICSSLLIHLISVIKYLSMNKTGVLIQVSTLPRTAGVKVCPKQE